MFASSFNTNAAETCYELDSNFQWASNLHSLILFTSVALWNFA